MSERPESDTIMEAVEAGDVGAVEAGLSAHPELAEPEAHGGVSPILAALYRGHEGVLTALLQRREPDVVEAAALGREERLETLLSEESGAAAARSHDGWTPLHLAAFFGHEGSVRLLLERGADPEAISANETANRPLHAALAGRGDPGVVATLLGAGVAVDPGAAGGYTPLHLAASRGDMESIRALLARGADPAREDARGRRPADLARERGHPEAARRLAEETGAAG